MELTGEQWKFVSACKKKGGPLVGKTKRGKGIKIMAIADRHGLPVSIRIESATSHEVKLVEATVKSRFTRKKPKPKTGAHCDAVGAGGTWSDCLRGCKTFVVKSLDGSTMQITF